MRKLFKDIELPLIFCCSFIPHNFLKRSQLSNTYKSSLSLSLFFILRFLRKRAECQKRENIKNEIMLKGQKIVFLTSCEEVKSSKSVSSVKPQRDLLHWREGDKKRAKGESK
jgi:hypothetical protein